MASTRAYSPEEQARMVQALPTARDRLLLLAGLYTGYRIHELLSLKIADLWQAGAPRSELVLDRGRLKGGAGQMKRRVRARAVMLASGFRAAVQAFVMEEYPDAEPPPGHFVFKSRKGDNRAISTVQAWRIIKTAARDCLGDATRIATHSARKSFARSIYDGSGHDIILTQRAMGHRSILTTSSYLESTQTDVEAAVLAIRGPGLVPAPSLPSPADGLPGLASA